MSSYFDFNVEFSKDIEYLSVDEFMYAQDLKLRKLFLKEEVNQFSVDNISKCIMQYNAEDAEIPIEDRVPIKLYISSNGGAVDDGFELIDVILSSVTPVYTINMGYEYSMAFLIGLAGHQRYCYKHSVFLMHDGTEFVWSSGSKAQDQIEFSKKRWSRVRDYVLERGNLSPDEYDSKTRVEWYMFADEAKEHGFVDYIVGEDVGIEDII